MTAGQEPIQAHIDELMGLVQQGEVRLDDIITHRLPLDEAARAHDMFNRKEDGCVKVVLAS